MDDKKLLSSKRIDVLLHRLACQLIENHLDFSNTVLIGLQPRGVYLADRIYKILKEKHHIDHLLLGYLDVTFFRDDFRRSKMIKANNTRIDFVVEDKKVVFIDDVLYTGRSIRSALTAIQSFGRPSVIELLIMIDRRFSRELPIQPTYMGVQVDAFNQERVIVSWKEKDGEDVVFLTEQ